MKLKTVLVGLITLITFTFSAQAADVNYPYGRISLNVPPSEDPFPGLGNYYSTLSKGMKSVLWNPASLGKLKLSETSISMATTTGTYNLDRISKVTEMSGTIEVTKGSEAAGRYAIFYRYPGVIGSGINTKEVEILSTASYATSGTGLNFTSALKINDWLVVGFAATNPLKAEMSLAGDFPLTARLNTSLYGQTIGDGKIGNDGKLRYTFSSEGIVTTYESTQSLWGGFISQEATIPLTTLTEIRDDLSIQSPYTGTIASKLGNFYLGMNIIPISATANIDNDLRAVVNSDTPDIFLYTPNFDKNSQTDLANWINDPDKYGKPDGYQRKQIKLPAGETVGSARYRGFYSASTARLDLGAIYDVTDWFTVGLAFENLGNSSLNFKGNGVASYINYRDINTTEAGSLEDLLSPGGKATFDFITDTWVTTFEVSGTKLYLEPEKTYTLPRKIRFGFAFKRPFLIAVDYEQNQNPIALPGTTEGSIANLSLLRVGFESQLFTLPFWSRIGLTFALKPTLTGVDQNIQDHVDKYFKYGVFPLKLDFGSTLNLWGYEIGDSLGVSAMPLISVLQFDTSNIDLSKIVYYSLSLKKDAWEVSLLNQVDALSTAAAYSNKPAPPVGEKKFEFTDVKFVQTLGVTYRF